MAVALTDLKAGSELETAKGSIRIKEDIPRGHKFALVDLPRGEAVIKYGFSIGKMVKAAEAGEHIHVHNLKTGLGDDLTYDYQPVLRQLPVQELSSGQKTFMGYLRPDGRAGVRNDLWIVPTVGCVNAIAQEIIHRCKRLKEGSIDAISAFWHPYGCSQMGDDQENTRKALSALIRHPNAGGVLVLGLGCENSGIELLKEKYLGDYDESRVRFLKCQDVEDELEEGVRLMEELALQAKSFKREPISVEKLIVGLKCGGSDGFSGITANPVVGRFSDILTSAGGSTILTEVPEMFGAETILMERCRDRATFDKTVALINGFKEYFRFHGQTIYENPSPGNKQGGISTLEDKALGCTQKSGFSPVVDVLDYTEPLQVRGLNLLKAPGNDLIASTALALSGAQLVLFTTGRGTPFACPVPTVKIASNPGLAERKKNWIDFNAGRLLTGTGLEELGEELYELVRNVASGESVKSEELERELALWKQGVTL